MARTFFSDMNYAFQQGGDLTEKIVTHQQKLLDQQAQLKARTQMLEYKVAENEFLKSLESDGDYENWQKKADNFLTSQKEYINQNAGNALTAKYMNQNLDASRANLQIQVGNKVFERMRKDELNEYNRQMQLVNENTSGQDRINGIEDLLKEMKNKNFVDEASYDKYVTQAYSSATLDEFNKVSDGISSQAVSNGWTEDKTEAEIKKAIEALPAFTMKSKSGEDISQLFTPQMKAEAVSAAVKRGNDVYKSNLEAYQTQNAEILAEIERRKKTLKPDDYKNINYLNGQGQKILAQGEKLNPNFVSAADKIKYAHMFQYVKEPEKGSAEARGNALKSLLPQLNENYKLWYWGDGDLKSIGTAAKILDYNLDIVRDYARAKNLDEDLLVAEARLEGIKELEKLMKDKPVVQNAFNDIYETCKKKINDPYKSQKTYEYFEEMLNSDILTLNLNTPDGQRKLQSRVKQIQIQIMEDDIKDRNEALVISEKSKSNSKYYSDNGSSQTVQQFRNFLNDAVSIKGLGSTSEYVYEDVRTGMKVVVPGAEDLINDIRTGTQRVLGGILGVDGSKIIVSWHQDRDHHVTDQLDFRLPDGRTLSPYSVNGKLFFKDENGKIVVTADQTDKYFDGLEKEQQWKAGSEQRAADAKTAEIKKNIKEANAEYDRIQKENDIKTKKARELQIFINEHEDEIQSYVDDGWRLSRSIQEVVNKYNENAADKIEYFDDWKSYLPSF